MSARDDQAREELVRISKAPRMVTNTSDGRHIALADAILAAGWRPPARIITERDEIDPLPTGAVILDDAGDVYECDEPLSWRSYGEILTSAAIAFPVTVLYDPREQA